jgi:DNA-binding beta-propeller fold protein YncE
MQNVKCKMHNGRKLTRCVRVLLLPFAFCTLHFAFSSASPAPRPPSPATSSSPLQLVHKIPLPGVEGRIDHMAVDTDGQRMFVAALGHNTLEVLDLKTGKHLRSIAGFREPQGVAYITATAGQARSGTDRIVVASGGDGSCRVYDGRSYRQLQEFKLGEDADNVRYDALTQRLYVGYGSGAIAAIDLARAARVADIALKGHPESFQLEANGKRIFVNVPTARQVAVIDRETRTVVATWPLTLQAANFPMALDETNHHLLVGCRTPPQLLVIDTETSKVTATAPCVGDTDDLFYDARNKRVYISGGEGAISVFEQTDADHYQPLARIPTAAGARTALFVPATGSLYLAVPHRGSQNAEVWVYAASKGRSPKGP